MTNNMNQQNSGSHQQMFPDSPPKYSEIINSAPPLPPRNQTRGFVILPVPQTYLSRSYLPNQNQPSFQRYSIPELVLNGDCNSERGHYASQFATQIQGNGYYLDGKNEPRRDVRSAQSITLNNLSLCICPTQSTYCTCNGGRSRIDRRLEHRESKSEPKESKIDRKESKIERKERKMDRKIDKKIAKLEKILEKREKEKNEKKNKYQ